MIDPTQSLAFSMQASPGIYAVLIGSGVSRAAKIPTGWEITLDLIRKLAAVNKEICDPDPEGWYRSKFGTDADYSELLDALAKTPTERQQLLSEYIEPNEQERETGEKQPTAAHHAIADLAAKGFVRVILTTNFDCLMETALRDKGVVPTILSSPDHVQGALPLIHTKCCVFKLHGDYLDTRIKNTPAELNEYPPEFDQLLDRIFDEFGLVVCGWSAEWDGALRNAIYRAKSHRFTTYWAVRGDAGDKAQRLIDHRQAQVISIKDADEFFKTVQQSVQSIDEYSIRHPLSTEIAVASLKHYMSESRYRIQLSDLIENEVEQVVEETPTPSSNDLSACVRRYEEACSTLLAMALVGGFWAEEDHDQVWQRALRRLGSRWVNITGFDPLLSEVQRYPATLLLYALGLGAVEADRLRFLGPILETPIRIESRNDLPAVQILRLPSLLRDRINHIHDKLRSYAKHIIPSDDQYTLMFDEFEILMSLSCAYRNPQLSGEKRYRNFIGDFRYRQENWERVMQEMDESLWTEQNDSPFVKSGIFGKTAVDCREIRDTWEAYIKML